MTQDRIWYELRIMGKWVILIRESGIEPLLLM